MNTDPPVYVFVHIWDMDNANVYSSREAALNGIAVNHDEIQRSVIADALYEAEGNPGNGIFLDTDGTQVVRYLSVVK